jgi:hypothetical protein
MKLLYSIGFIGIMVWAAACIQEGGGLLAPDSASGRPGGSQSLTTAETPTPTPAETPAAPGVVTATRPRGQGKTVISTFDNGKTFTERAVLCTFSGGQTGVQTLFDQADQEVRGGKQKTLTAKIPCGPWQADALIGAGDCPDRVQFKDDWASYDLEILNASLSSYDGPECKSTECELTPAICEAKGPGWYFDPVECVCKKRDPSCKDYIVAIDATKTGETATHVTYTFEVRVNGALIATKVKTFERQPVASTETFSYVFVVEGIECPASVQVKIAPTEEPKCEDYDITMDTTKTEETASQVTYHFDVLVDGNLLHHFDKTYDKELTARTEQECYTAIPTDSLECEVCATVKIGKRPLECEAPDEQCLKQHGQFRCSDLGLVTLFKNDRGGGQSCTTAQMNAVAVIVKGGTKYHVIPNVKQGDSICTCGERPKDWSHVEYCGCPEPD